MKESMKRRNGCVAPFFVSFCACTRLGMEIMMARKICILLLIFCMSCFSFSANAEVLDTVGTEYEIATELLHRLGIITLEDGYFYPASGITKGDFLVTLFKVIGINIDTSEADIPDLFFDVAGDSAYAPYVFAAYKYGMIIGNGDGFFGANKVVTRTEAVTMIIRALKYERIAESKGGYPIGYETVATELGLTGGVGLTATGELTKAAAAKMLYNTLFTKAIEFSVSNGDVIFSTNKDKNAKNLMNTNFNVYEVKGIVDGNEFAEIPLGQGISKGKVSINSYTYDVIDEFAHSYFGHNVVAYTRYTEDENTIIYMKDINNDVTVVDAKYVSKYAIDSIEYYTQTSERTIKKRISPYVSAVVNNVAVNPDLGISIPLYGDITLVDNNQDNLIDTVIVSDIEVFCVGSVDNLKKTVYNKYNTADFICLLDFENYKIIGVNGERLEITDIKPDMLVEVIRNNKMTFVTIKAVDQKQQITVSEAGTVMFGDNEYSYVTDSSGKEYIISSYFSLIMKNSKINLGETYVFLLDSKEQIASIALNFTDAMTIGYIVKFSNELKGIDKEMTLKIFTLDEIFIEVKTADKILNIGQNVTTTITSTDLKLKLDAMEADDKTWWDAAASTAGSSTVSMQNWIIRFALDKDGKLSKIEFPGDNQFGTGLRKAGSVASLGAKGNQAANRYKTGSRTIGGKVLIDNNTRAICVPRPVDEDDESLFSVSTHAYFVSDGYFPFASGFTTVDNSVAAEYVVVPGATATVGSDSPIMVFDNISTAYDEADECIVQRVNGYVGGKKVGYNVKPGVLVKPYNKGDILQFVTNGKSQISLFEPIYDLATNVVANSSWTSAAFSLDRKVTVGQPKSKVDDKLFIDGLDFIYVLGTAAIYEFDGTEIKVITKNDIATLEDGVSTNAFIYLRYSEPRVIVIYK